MAKMNILQQDPYWTVVPKPAFCVKLRHKLLSGEEKIFFNFCACPELPSPKEDIDENGLALILESSDPGRYTIPISVGEPRAEEDNRGQPCTAYEIILNDAFYSRRIADSDLFKGFLILIAIDAVESKYALSDIDRQNWVILKNRKCLGEIHEQKIRKQPKPLITEMDVEKNSQQSVTEEISKVEIVKDKMDNPTKITATFNRLDGAHSACDIDLQISQHRIRVIAQKIGYEEDIFLPVSLNTGSVKAKFLVDKGKLIVDIALQ